MKLDLRKFVEHVRTKEIFHASWNGKEERKSQTISHQPLQSTSNHHCYMPTINQFSVQFRRTKMTEKLTNCTTSA